MTRDTEMGKTRKQRWRGNRGMETEIPWERGWHGNGDDVDTGMTWKLGQYGKGNDAKMGMTWKQGRHRNGNDVGGGGGGGRIGQRGIGGDYESNYEDETNRRDSDNSAKEYTGLDNADTTCIPATGASTCYCSCLSRRSVDRVLDALRYEWKLGLCASLTIWNKRSSTFLQKNERKKVRDSLFVPM